MEDFLKFGIPELDEALGGGLGRNSLNMISGETGTGKTILATHFLAEGVKGEEKCCFISTTVDTDRIRKHLREMEVFKEAEKKIEWINFSPTAKELFPVSDKLIEATFEKFCSLSERWGRLVIDTITTFERVFADVSLARDWMFKLNKHLAKCGTTTIFVEEAAKTMAPSWDSSRNICETMFLLDILPVGDRLVRGLKIMKKYGYGHPLEWMLFKITDKGIVMLPEKRRVSPLSHLLKRVLGG